MSGRPRDRDRWVYEDLVDAIPGLHLRPRYAVALQFLGFEIVVLLVALGIDRPAAAVPGTAAVIVATAGSAAMVSIARVLREADDPAGYRQILFGSNIEILLGVVSYAALLAYLFVGAAGPEPGLLERALGPDPSPVAVFVAFVLAWDVCYRIGVGWWASVVGCWRSLTAEFSLESAGLYYRADLATIGFAAVQLVLVPVLLDEPLLAIAVVGHVGAVVVVSGASLLALRRRKISPPESA